MGEPMRILMLAHRIPYPPHTGDKVRAYHVARHLARHHDVTLGFLVDDGNDLAGLGAMRQVVGDLEYARLWKPWSVLKGLGAMATGRSLSLAYFGSRRLATSLAARVDREGYDLVYASSTPVARYVRGLGIPVIMDFVDVDSDKWMQFGEKVSAPRSWLYRAEGRRLQACEADIAEWASLCVLATTAEETMLKSFAPWARTAVVPNGVDLEYCAPVVTEPEHPTILFTGAMDYLPNVDAVRYFCADIFPRVRRSIPDARFLIVGLDPSAPVRRLAQIPGVVVTGAVPDVRPYYERAAVCVAPLRMGRGVQNKVIQGMAMGRPVVASTLAGRGLAAETGKHLHIESDAAAFAHRVVELLRDPAERRALGKRARTFVEANHAWDSSLSRIDELLVEVAQRGGRSRGSSEAASRSGHGPQERRNLPRFEETGRQ